MTHTRILFRAFVCGAILAAGCRGGGVSRVVSESTAAAARAAWDTDADSMLHTGTVAWSDQAWQTSTTPGVGCKGTGLVVPLGPLGSGELETRRYPVGAVRGDSLQPAPTPSPLRPWSTAPNRRRRASPTSTRCSCRQAGSGFRRRAA